MKKHKIRKVGFGKEVSRILPLILREFARRQSAFFSKTAISMTQIVILDILKESDYSRMNELAATLNFTKSALTSIIDKMIRLKLVRRLRSTKDRRVVNVTILRKGRMMIRQVQNMRRGCINSMFSTLTEKDRKDYLRVLRKAVNNLRQKK